MDLTVLSRKSGRATF